jgi:hypothetical protein
MPRQQTFAVSPIGTSGAPLVGSTGSLEEPVGDRVTWRPTVGRTLLMYRTELASVVAALRS